MKHLLAFITISSVLSGPALAEEMNFTCAKNQVSWGEAMAQSQILPPSDESALPSLPCGWKWQKQYAIDDNHPDQWSWQSWPDGVNVEIKP